MNFLLEFSKEQFSQKNLPFSDVITSGGMVFITGMLTVFSVLGILWVALLAFKFFFHDLSHGEKKIKNEKPAPAMVSSAPVASDDNEIVAVIAAAIAMAESESGSGTKFRVVSFKRK